MGKVGQVIDETECLGNRQELKKKTDTDLNFIIFAQGHRSDSILGPELFGERRGHQTAPAKGNGY